MEGLVMSQKCVQFLNQVLKWRCGEPVPGYPTPIRPVNGANGNTAGGATGSSAAGKWHFDTWKKIKFLGTYLYFQRRAIQMLNLKMVTENQSENQQKLKRDLANENQLKLKGRNWKRKKNERANENQRIFPRMRFTSNSVLNFHANRLVP
jgi:hypothetical protein